MSGSSVADAIAPPLAEWKLTAPHVRPGVVLRPRLFAVLDRREDAALTLITAPAGYGKTQLLVSWLASNPGLSVAWVSLDPGEADPLRLWTYVAHAVDRVRPGMARPALARLRTPGIPVEEALDELTNGIATFAGRLVIALDDLHHFASGQQAASLAYAVDHLPATARIVATTRADPVVRLGRLRAGGAVAEIRASQLAFTVAETKALLVDGMKLRLTDEELRLLAERAEGWPAAVSLAGLWLSEVEDPGVEVRTFAGDQRQVADYLTDEVLEALDGETRRFMVRTSILDRLCGSLCDAVLETAGSGQRLEALSRSNLFVVPLDGKGEWYRYHQLFRDLLRLELSREDQPLIRRLHDRAAAWFVEHEMIDEALTQRAAMGPQDEVAALLLAVHMRLIRSGRADLLMRWLEWLPDEHLQNKPELAASGAIASILLGRPSDERARLLNVAEASLDGQPALVRQRVEFGAALARSIPIERDLSDAIRNTRLAVERRPLQGDVTGLAAVAALGYALYLQGDLAEAASAIQEALARPDAPQHPHAFVYALAVAALVEHDRGQPATAEETARRSLEIAKRLGLTGAWSAGLARLAMGRVLLSLGRAAEAERHLERAERLRRSPQPTLEHAHALLLLAEARVARGRLPLAAAELDAATEALGSFADAGRLPALAEHAEHVLSDALAEAPHVLEPPTPAELSVLRLLATDLSQREIAHQLFLSFNTVRTHTRNLYRKLGANTRDDAVRRAAEVGLIEMSASPG